MADTKDPTPVDRRKILLYALAGVGATAAGVGARAWRNREDSAPSAPVVPDGPGLVVPGAKVTQRRRLGRTGLDVSVIGIGAGGIERTGVIARAVDLGMNYVDTSTCYGGSEDVLGRAFKDFPGLRDKLIVATKWDPNPTTSKATMLASLDSSLRRLGVDRIDVMQLHWLGGGHVRPDDGYNRLENSALYEAMEDAKKAGKVRFFGATSHDGNRSKILRAAIDKGAFDMILVKMNVLDFEGSDIPALLRRAKEKDVGVVVMKSQPAGGHIPPGFEKSKWNIYQSNLRWVLQQDVACVVHSALGTDEATQDLAVSAVHEPFTENDAELLDRYAAALSPEYCRGCGDICGAACPSGVAIAPVLQFAMYEKNYGWRAYAKKLYGALPPRERGSEACLTCSACTTACPFGLDVQGRVLEAQKLLG